MNTKIFNVGDRVIYTPPHTNSDVSHRDSERGTVSTVRPDGAIFVHYDADRSSTGKRTPINNLVHVDPFKRKVINE